MGVWRRDALLSCIRDFELLQCLRTRRSFLFEAKIAGLEEEEGTSLLANVNCDAVRRT